jgi:hypothetical protein
MSRSHEPPEKQFAIPPQELKQGVYQRDLVCTRGAPARREIDLFSAACGAKIFFWGDAGSGIGRANGAKGVGKWFRNRETGVSKNFQYRGPRTPREIGPQNGRRQRLWVVLFIEQIYLLFIYRIRFTVRKGGGQQAGGFRAGTTTLVTRILNSSFYGLAGPSGAE